MLNRNTETAKQLINLFYHRSEENEVFLRKNLQYLTENQLNWKSNTESWSIGECISHLIVCHKAYQSKLEFAIKDIPSNQKDDFRYKNSFPGKWIINKVDPDNKKKTKTFKVFNPLSSNHESNIFSEFFEVLNHTGELVSRMKNLNLAKIKISSPANKFIRINLGDALIILAIHDTRHLNQAKSITEMADFPAS